MRRLQGNLTYLAALADRKGGQVPPCPAYLMPPSLNMNIKMRAQPPAPTESPGKQVDPGSDREERERFLRDMYRKLQALFPGIDPRREPAFSMQNAKAGSGGGQTPQGGGPPNQNHQQRPAGGQVLNQARHGSPNAAAHQIQRAMAAANPAVTMAGQVGAGS